VSGPLAGYRVIDLTTTFSGPFCTQLLGDLGADVIKVEHPEGDIIRGFPPSRSDLMGSVFLGVNRGKRSVVLDLKSPDGRAAFIALLETADALVHNMRPDAMVRLGLDYASVADAAPRLVYCAITGYGSGGRYEGRAAYDDIVQGMSGLAWLQGIATGDDPKYMATVLADKTAGLSAAAAVLAALLHRGPTGTGQQIEVPMFETLAAYALAEQMGGRSFDPPLGPTGYARLRSIHRRPYATQNGFVCVLLYTGAQWRSFLTFVGRAHLLDDDRYSSVGGRAANVNDLYAIVADEISRRTTEEWLERLLELDIPSGPMQSLDDLFDDPHLNDVDFFQVFEHPTEGSVVGLRNPLRFSGTPLDGPAVLRPAPGLGQHTAEVLAELGLAPTDRPTDEPLTD
jgi:crotonobetainyl-CoA:carnitine CoA-transferase CaiB-like acyl-CoA transferase